MEAEGRRVTTLFLGSPGDPVGEWCLAEVVELVQVCTCRGKENLYVGEQKLK